MTEKVCKNCKHVSEEGLCCRREGHSVIVREGFTCEAFSEKATLPVVCNYCKYLGSKEEFSYMEGTCRYNPPTREGFPAVSYEDWCGKFERRR